MASRLKRSLDGLKKLGIIDQDFKVPAKCDTKEKLASHLAQVFSSLSKSELTAIFSKVILTIQSKDRFKPQQPSVFHSPPPDQIRLKLQERKRVQLRTDYAIQPAKRPASEFKQNRPSFNRSSLGQESQHSLSQQRRKCLNSSSWKIAVLEEQSRRVRERLKYLFEDSGLSPSPVLQL